MPHPALSKDRVAVITGGASGIGLAAAKRFAAIGMKLVLADLRQDALERPPGPAGSSGGVPPTSARRWSGREFAALRNSVVHNLHL